MSHTFILQVMNLTISQCLKHVKQPKMKAENLMLISCFSGVRVARSLVFRVMFCRSLFVLLSVVLSVLLRFTTSDYPFSIFKLFVQRISSLNREEENKSNHFPILWNDWKYMYSIIYGRLHTFLSSFDFNDLGIHDLLTFSLDCNILVDIL